jgi:hypothetical protein
MKCRGVVRDTTFNGEDIILSGASNISTHCPFVLLADLSLREGKTLRIVKVKRLKFY